jgi:hypothetical protein
LEPKLLYNVALVVLSTAIVCVSGCEDSYIFPNEAPGNLEITKPSCYVSGGEEVPLVATADDADGDPIYFRWTTTAGFFDPADGRGRVITWIAPDDTPGPAVITLVVTDEIEESRLQTTIEVGAEFPVNKVTNEPLHPTIADSGFVYILNLQPIEIPGGTTFTIMEGVRIVARGQNSGFEVAGRLVILGTEENPVTMGPDDCVPVEGSWAGIAFRGFGASGSITYIQQYSADIGLLVKTGADVVISNSSLINNKLYGIELSDGGVLGVSDCTLWENDTGLYMRNGHLTVERSSLRYNRHAGIELSAVSAEFAPPGTHCNVSNNEDYGFDIFGLAAPEIHYNALYSNGFAGEGYGIYLGTYQGADSIQAENNFWGLGYDSEDTIPVLIYDAHDAPSSIQAYVGFIPWLSNMPAEVPNP